ncbi:hypothetical protein [Ectothiorhodospira sp. PHS-1]|nr:hypothetical protein [Ectothiorhodospira sp. PHS-1]
MSLSASAYRLLRDVRRKLRQQWLGAQLMVVSLALSSALDR